MTSNKSSARVSVKRTETAGNFRDIYHCLGLTKLKVEHNEMNRVEDSEEVPGISLSINGLDVTKNKFTGHLLDSCICHAIWDQILITSQKHCTS